MRVCLDTNVLLRLFGKEETAKPIRDALLAGKLQWAISGEILFEYEEVITRLSGKDRWLRMEKFLNLLSRLHGNMIFSEPQFRFGVIVSDTDDNKFVDCAITADVDYIITFDRHFDALAGSGYKPQSITPQDFISRFLSTH